MARDVVNLVASVHQRLLNMARASRRPAAREEGASIMRTAVSRALVVVALGCLVAFMTAISGCTKISPVSTSPNLAPETTLTARGEPAPGGARQILLQWLGSDEDGSVDHYLVRLDTLDWHEVTRTESVFVFPGPTKRPRRADEEERHSFTVKSVDDRGEEDPTPAVVWFTPRNELPETVIVNGPEAVTGPMVFFEWAGTDPDGVIAAYDYRLLARWDSEWHQVVPDPSSGESITVGPDVTTVLFGPLAGMHKFEVWATDDEGGEDPTPAECIFTCNPELAGAVLTVSTNVLGTHAFRGPVWPDSYNVPVDVFQEHLTFNWIADASAYGGQVVAYRHAFDDTSTWPPWSLYDRTFEITPEPGLHSLYICVLDNANVMTRARIFIDVSATDLSQYIVLVDDYDLWETNPDWGTDADRDAFYDSLLHCYERPVIEWNPEEHEVTGVPQPPDVATLASASTVIWYADSDPYALDGIFYDPCGRSYSPLAGYVRVGGNLLLCGSKLLRTILDEPYPVVVTAEDTTSAAVFVRDCLRICCADNSGEAADPSAPWSSGYCMHGAVPTPAGEALGFEPVYVDTGDCDVQPGKWWFYCDPPLPGYYHCGLNVERLVSFQGTSLEIYATDSFLNPNYEGETSVVLYLSGDNHGNVCYMGFPLYYLKTFQVKAFFDELLPLFGEAPVGETGIGE